MSKYPPDRRQKEVRNSAISGACAGLVSSVVTCPLDVIKTRLQVRPEASASGSITHGGFDNVTTVIRKIWTEDGLRGFYRGLSGTHGDRVPPHLGYLLLRI